MPHQVTVSGKVDGGFSVTNKVITNVSSFNVNCVRQTLQVVDTNNQSRTYDISTATTITCTISSGFYTLSVS